MSITYPSDAKVGKASTRWPDPSSKGGSTGATQAIRHRDARFDLRRVDTTTWIIRDAGLPANDPHHVIACVHDDGEAGVEVVWIEPLPLPVRYAGPDDVLSDLYRWARHPQETHRPVPIPHIPPLRARVAG